MTGGAIQVPRKDFQSRKIFLVIARKILRDWKIIRESAAARRPSPHASHARGSRIARPRVTRHREGQARRFAGR